MNGMLLSLAAAVVAVLAIYAVFGSLPSWALIPLALCISVPLVLWWRGYWSR